MMAGIAISIGGYIYLNCLIIGGLPVGAFLFAFGLLSVVYHEWPLFTGKAGFASTQQEHKELFYYLFLNLIGAFGCGLLARLLGNESAEAVCYSLCASKVNTGLFELFIRAVGCGAMMFLAVYGWIKTQKPLMVILPVTIFILSGFEHSIADAFYFAYGAYKSIWSDMWISLITIIIGNYIGAQLIKHLTFLDRRAIMYIKHGK